MAKHTAEIIETVMSTVMGKVLPDLMTQIVEKFDGCLNKLLVTFESKLKDKLEMVNGELYSANVRIDSFEKKLADAQKMIDDHRTEQIMLRKEIATLQQQLEEQEQYIKRDNLVFHGVGESEGEDTTTKVVDLCQRHFPTVKLQASDISISHRLPTKSTDKTKPIIVRFTRRDIRQQIFRNKKCLKNTNITVVEQLTNKKAKLVTTATALMKQHKLLGTWTNDGKVFIKQLDGSIKSVTTELDLAGL